MKQFGDTALFPMGAFVLEGPYDLPIEGVHRKVNFLQTLALKQSPPLVLSFHWTELIPSPQQRGLGQHSELPLL